MAEELEGPSFFSYNLTVETPIDIDELIYTLSPMDLPLLTGVGGDGVPLLGTAPLHNTAFSWLEETTPLPRGTLNEALDGSETDVDVATGDAVKFHVGDGILIDSEIMIVTDIDTTTEILTVARGSASLTNTTAATHASGAEIVGIGSILIEGGVASANFQGRDKITNYAQIYSTSMKVSATAQVIPKYGIPSELSHQMAAAMQHLMTSIEQSALYGVKHIVTATNRRQTGGLNYHITTNVNSTDEWLTVDSIQEQQSAAWEAGGMFEVVVARPGAFAALNNLTGREGITTVEINDPRRGRRKAQSVMTEFGEVTLARDRWVRKSDAFAYSRANFVKRVLRPLTQVKLAKTDDADTYMMVTELGFEVKGEKHMAKWTALNPAAAFPGGGLV